jgi:hypothetical protein
MPGEEAEIPEGIDEEMESIRRIEQRVAARRASELAHSTGSPRRPDQRPRASARVKVSRAGQEPRALRRSGGSPQRWHETVKGNDENPALDTLQTLARTTHRTGSAPRRHQRRRRR